MALHCAATLVLVPVGTVPDDAAGSGAVVVGALAPGADVVEELQAVADAGDVEHRAQGAGATRGHFLQSAIVEYHVGRHAVGVGPP